MDLPAAITDAWSSKLDYFRHLTHTDAGTNPTVPTGFPVGMDASTWAEIIRGMFQSRIRLLKADRDGFGPVYAENTENAVQRWEHMGGPTLPGAYQQMVAALDCIVLEAAGLDAVAALTSQIRTYASWYASQTGSAPAVFPHPPPFSSRERLLSSTTPAEFARYIAVGVILLPYIDRLAEHPPEGDQDLATSQDTLSSATLAAGTVESVASQIMEDPASESTAPVQSLGSLREVILVAKRALAPGVPHSVRDILDGMDRQILAVSTSLDRLEDAQRQVQHVGESVGGAFIALAGLAFAGAVVLSKLGAPRGPSLMETPETPPKDAVGVDKDETAQ